MDRTATDVGTEDAVTATDIARQSVVIAATVFMLVAAMAGTGLLGGTPVQELQDGALDVDGSLLAPARTAFSIWTAIYLLLVAYAVWQALPGQRTRVRQRRIGWWVALSAVLNGLWLVLAQYTTLPLTVAGIVALLLVLCVTFQRSVSEPSEGFLDTLLIDGATGLHLGWVSLATVANVAAWLTADGPPSWAASGEVWGVLVLVVVGAIGIAIAVVSRWRTGPAIALVWGLSWLAVARLGAEPSSTAIGVTAAVVAVVIALVTALGTIAYRVISFRNAGA